MITQNTFNPSSSSSASTTSIDTQELSYRTVSKSDITSSSTNETDTIQTQQQQQQPPSSLVIDPKHHRYPYCIVWTPIPIITTLIPCIGHTGICTSNGIIHDFAGSYYVGVDNMAFGSPCKYVILSPNHTERTNWDRCVDKGDERFNNEAHNLCLNNCHSHCAYVLNLLKYNNKSNYTMFHIWWMLITKGKYISFKHIIKTYIGFIIVLIVYMIIYCLLK